MQKNGGWRRIRFVISLVCPSNTLGTQDDEAGEGGNYSQQS